MHMQGYVKWFRAEKGFGFIQGENGQDYFAHFSEIQMEGYKQLSANQAVTFDVATGAKGKYAAKIRIVDTFAEKAAA
jgi:cold shock protein